MLPIYVFPGNRLSVDPLSGIVRCHHLHARPERSRRESRLQEAVRAAAQATEIPDGLVPTPSATAEPATSWNPTTMRDATHPHAPSKNSSATLPVLSEAEGTSKPSWFVPTSSTGGGSPSAVRWIGRKRSAGLRIYPKLPLCLIVRNQKWERQSKTDLPGDRSHSSGRSSITQGSPLPDSTEGNGRFGL